MGDKASLDEQTPKMAYVITTGAYSDYRIVAVYLDKELAERMANAMNLPLERRQSAGGYIGIGEGSSVEPYEIWDTAPDAVTRYRVTLDVLKDGPLATPQISEEEEYGESEYAPLPMRRIKGGRRLAGTGTNKERTIRGVLDRAAAVKAQMMGVAP